MARPAILGHEVLDSGEEEVLFGSVRQVVAWVRRQRCVRVWFTVDDPVGSPALTSRSDDVTESGSVVIRCQ